MKTLPEEEGGMVKIYFLRYGWEGGTLHIVVVFIPVLDPKLKAKTLNPNAKDKTLNPMFFSPTAHKFQTPLCMLARLP